MLGNIKTDLKEREWEFVGYSHVDQIKDKLRVVANKVLQLLVA
jgi:hypothetical protein